MIPNADPRPPTGRRRRERRRRRPHLALALALALSSGCGGTDEGTIASSGTQPLAGLPTGTLTIDAQGGEVTFEVWIAETSESRQRGLMLVERMDAENGMVFLFAESTDGPFWMKDTLIPLSIAFWDREGTIVGVLDMQPCQSDPCPLYSPGASYVGAVEVNLGALGAAGVAAGDSVELRRDE
jgi:uncharacterized membrane protein (UPF0127 family)